MPRDPKSGPAQHNEDDTQAAAGGPKPVGYPTYAEVALKLLDNGYEPLPILPGTKRPAPNRWTSISIEEAQVSAWSRSWPTAGIGLRTGHLVAIDIDVDEPDLAHKISAEAERLLGPTMVRVGRWPRRLLIYRTEVPFPKRKVGPVEVLGLGQQFVAYAVHPDTGRPYEWVTGESPAEVPLQDLPLIDAGRIDLLLAAVVAFTGADENTHQAGARSGQATPGATGGGWHRDERGMVIDGRDAWMSAMAFHAVHDALDRGGTLGAQALAAQVWSRFEASADLTRGRQSGAVLWTVADAHRKVCDKLRLQSCGRLPGRTAIRAEPSPLGEMLPTEEARARLDAAIRAALEAFTEWWEGDRSGIRPVAGIRATVGLGKSAVSRTRIADWQAEMQARSLQHRVLVVTPSHALAEEAAASWRKSVAGSVAVLRGYDVKDPVTGKPMCQDTSMVHIAIAAGLSVGKSVCRSSKKWSCPHYTGCLKQENRHEVARADVVLAPYDVLFTGPAAGTEPFGLIVIDEGFWQRSIEAIALPPIEKIASAGLSGIDSDDLLAGERQADLAALRSRLAAALGDEPGPIIQAETLNRAGITSSLCAEAAAAETSLVREADIYPGMSPRARREATAVVRRNAILQRMADLWHTLAMIIEGAAGAPVISIALPSPAADRRSVGLHRRKTIVDALAGIPVLHLDATLRQPMLDLFFPEASVTAIEAAQPHQHLTLVSGGFGKTSIVPSAACPADELARRRNRLQKCTDHVRWQALRIAPRRVLVVTYMAIEEAFAGIPGVETAHFNAIAGLDRYGDVGLLMVIGRPLPSTADIASPCASLFGHVPQGRYQKDTSAVHMRDGWIATVKTLTHADVDAETLRAAICDDEVIQAIGRGRGVNRTAGNPLEVQVLADVALPLIHDRVVPWESLVPDVLQKMLLAGVAVDSPTDAAALHPGMFKSANEAKLAFARAGFKGQNPIGTTYREMTLKSARYLRGGRGRSWQWVWWIVGSAGDARKTLEVNLGSLAEWTLSGPG
jgi:Bifunctional DNA primase/polymerase, N-terminal